MALSGVVHEGQKDVRDGADLETDVFRHYVLETWSLEDIDPVSYADTSSLEGNLNIIVSDFSGLSGVKDFLVVFIRELTENPVSYLIVRLLTSVLVFFLNEIYSQKSIPAQ